MKFDILIKMCYNEMVENYVMDQEAYQLNPEDLYYDVVDIHDILKVGWIEAFVFYCDKNDYDIEQVAKLIPSSLKFEMECEAKKLHLLKKTTESMLDV